MKLAALTIILGMTFSSSAFADKQELVSLNCSGANGLELEIAEDTDIVQTKLGAFRRKFETNRAVFVYDQHPVTMSRIALGRVGASHVYVYDIYLSEVPVRGQSATITGWIGKSIYGLGLTPMGPVPLPIGFVPTTTLNCDVLTK